ncbi:hypothetical protein HMPREF1982_00398 [Clostridiales bacterium oral taxon 876 str. F0540]|nr:hypothetical protein HMPREF1982_00398 [Clostridiales bacterium oral taxon 876 str. F0540]
MKCITLKKIREILENSNLSGKTLHVREIQDLIRKNYKLSPEDYLPYVNTRKTTYQYWQSQVQKVLYYLSRDNKITHHHDTESYTF